MKRDGKGYYILYLIVLLFSFFSQKSEGQLSGIVHFATNSSLIEPVFQTKLRHLVKVWRSSAPVCKVEIAGYCDSAGSNIYNDRLSLSRANAVYQYLIRNGLPENFSYDIKGFGKRKPFNDNKSGTRRYENRKVVITIHPSDEKKKISEKQVRLPDYFDTAKTGSHIIIPGLNFYPGRHHLLPVCMPVLDTLLQIMKTHPGLKIQIQGHVCCTQNGEEGEDNDTRAWDLSWNRAKIIYEYLVENGIKSERLSYTGMAGKFHLVNPELTEEDRMRNRRVEAIIINR